MARLTRPRIPTRALTAAAGFVLVGATGVAVAAAHSAPAPAAALTAPTAAGRAV